MVVTALACFAPVISHSIGRSLYGLLLTAMRDDFGLSNAEAGLPGSGIFVCYVVGVILVVVFSPRAEPVTIMRWAVALSVVGLVITATSGGLVTLTVGVALVGGAGAGIWMTAPVLATEYVSVERRGLVIGVLTSTIGLSNISFGFGTRWLRNAADDPGLWRPVWWIAAGFAAALLVGLVVVARFSPTDRIDRSQGVLAVLRQVPRWKQITLAYALFGGMTAGFGTFIIAAVEDHGGVDASTSPIIFSAMGIVGMLTAPLAGAWSDRVGRLTVLRYDLALLVVANLCVSAGGALGTITGALLYAGGAAALPALIATYVRDTLDSRSFSQALATMTILFSLMAAVTPALIGKLADTSFRWSYLVLAALAFVGFGFMTAAARPPAISPAA